MKKIVWIFVFWLVCVLLTGCGDKNVDEVTYNDSVDVEEEKMPEVMPIEDEIVNESQNYDAELLAFTTKAIRLYSLWYVVQWINIFWSAFFTWLNNWVVSATISFKTAGGKQRHNFFGLVLSDNKISRAYSCIWKNNKIYCIEGSTNGAYHSNNIGILNQIFTADQCRYISDGHTYTCTDGSYNGDTKTSGYTSLHYETSCTIYWADAKTGELICH